MNLTVEDYHQNHLVLDIAIRKLQSLESRLHSIKITHALSLWQKFSLRILVLFLFL